MQVTVADAINAAVRADEFDGCVDPLCVGREWEEGHSDEWHSQHLHLTNNLCNPHLLVCDLTAVAIEGGQEHQLLLTLSLPAESSSGEVRVLPTTPEEQINGVRAEMIEAPTEQRGLRGTGSALLGCDVLIVEGAVAAGAAAAPPTLPQCLGSEHPITRGWVDI